MLPSTWLRGDDRSLYSSGVPEIAWTTDWNRAGDSTLKPRNRRTADLTSWSSIQLRFPLAHSGRSTSSVRGETTRGSGLPSCMYSLLIMGFSVRRAGRLSRHSFGGGPLLPLISRPPPPSDDAAAAGEAKTCPMGQVRATAAAADWMDIARSPHLTGGRGVETRGLTKVFHPGRRTLLQGIGGQPDRREPFRAVDGIDLQVEVGEIFGILGPNGAGKTTILRMLATLLEPTEGEARVLGIDVRTGSGEVRRRLGAAMSGERSLYWKLTGRENLEYYAALYHLPRRTATPRIDAVLRTVELTDRADDYVERYSTGMRQRLARGRPAPPAPQKLLAGQPTCRPDPQLAPQPRDPNPPT